MTNSKMTFEAFMEKVDSYIEDICGFNSEDMPDFNYYDYWESGMTAKRTALESINNARDY